MLIVSRNETKITCDSDDPRCNAETIRAMDPIVARREASKRKWVERFNDVSGPYWTCPVCKMLKR